MVSGPGSYPHPVLGDTGDASSIFEVVNFTYVPSVDDIQIRFQVRMDDPDVKKLLENGEARYSVRWTCSSTISSDELTVAPIAQHADGESLEGWIDQQNVRGKVVVEVRILATVEIDHYRLSSQHPDYGDATFHILPGDVLAYYGPFDFEPHKRYDPFNPPVGALFRFVDLGSTSREIKIDFSDDDHILVTFKHDLLAGLAAHAGRVDLQISLVVLPALIQTIVFVDANRGADGEDLTGRSWYEPICKLVGDNGGFDTPALEVAQRILNYPLDTSLGWSVEIEEDE